MKLPYLRLILGLMLCASSIFGQGDLFEPTLREAQAR
jgi:hypothetical protein